MKKEDIREVRFYVSSFILACTIVAFVFFLLARVYDVSLTYGQAIMSIVIAFVFVAAPPED